MPDVENSVEEFAITVKTPGSPGASFTQNVKDMILTFETELEHHDNFSSLKAYKTHLTTLHYKESYVRNILAFMTNCGMVEYPETGSFENEKVFTNIGKAYVDILKCIKIAEDENDSPFKDAMLERLSKVEQTIMFQCLAILMRNTDCNYSRDFYDLLSFVEKYGSIDSAEYMYILYMRESHTPNYLDQMADNVYKYRNKELEFIVTTETKNGTGAKKSVNSMPYVTGNFSKAGVLEKVPGDSSRFQFNQERIDEIEDALRKGDQVWLSSATEPEAE